MTVLADMSFALRRMIINTLKQVIVPAVGASVLVYFGYYAIHGDRGLLAKHQLEMQITEAQHLLQEVRSERVRMEIRDDRLRRDHLDLDLLEERAREMLNFAHARDLIVPLPKLYEPDTTAE